MEFIRLYHVEDKVRLRHATYCVGHFFIENCFDKCRERMWIDRNQLQGVRELLYGVWSTWLENPSIPMQPSLETRAWNEQSV
jgi:hypothetical protein